MITNADLESLSMEERLKLVEYICDTLLTEPLEPQQTNDLWLRIDSFIAEAERPSRTEPYWDEFRNSMAQKLERLSNAA